MTVKAIIDGRPHEVITISGDASVADAVSALAKMRIGALPVMDGKGVAGIISERDIVYCLERDGTAALGALVRDVMTAPAVTVAMDHPVMGALSLMTKRRIRHLPVVDGDRLIGFVSIGDLVKHRIDAIEAEANAMRDYIQGA